MQISGLSFNRKENLYMNFENLYLLKNPYYCMQVVQLFLKFIQRHLRRNIFTIWYTFSMKLQKINLKIKCLSLSLICTVYICTNWFLSMQLSQKFFSLRLLILRRIMNKTQYFLSLWVLLHCYSYCLSAINRFA